MYVGAKENERKQGMRKACRAQRVDFPGQSTRREMKDRRGSDVFAKRASLDVLVGPFPMGLCACEHTRPRPSSCSDESVACTAYIRELAKTKRSRRKPDYCRIVAESNR